MKKKEFNKLVGFSSIVGAVATIIATLISIFAQNQDLKSADTTISQNNSNNADTILNNSGDVQIYNAEGDQYINNIEGDQYIYNQVNSDDNIVDNSETLLYQRLKDNVTDEILCFVPDDFDNDGEKEAFAFVGHLSDDGENATWDGIPYFINNKIIQKLSSDTRYGYSVDRDWYMKGCREIELGKNKGVVFTLYYASTSIDEIYGLKNGNLIRYRIPNTKGKLQVTENFITLIVDAYDASWEEINDDRCGHTWKPYYFFWNDGINNFSEYGGIEITLDQLNQLKDVSNVVNEYKNNGYNIYNILYRANGIININFEKIEEPDIIQQSEYKYQIMINHLYKNITLHIKYDTKNLLQDEIIENNSGIYLSAINPQIAVYPDFPVVY